MVDIGMIFGKSFTLLKKNRVLLLPLLARYATIILLVLIFIGISVLSYSPQHLIGSSDKTGLDAQVTDGPWNFASGLDKYFNHINLLALITLFLAGYAAWYYTAVASLAMIAMVFQKETMTLRAVLKNTNRYIIKELGLELFILLISWVVTLPIMLIAMIAPLGILVLPFALVFLGVKLMFILPSLFLDGAGIWVTVKNGYTATKGKFWWGAIFLFFIGVVAMLAVFANYAAILAGVGFFIASPIIMAFLLPIFIAFLILSAGLSVFHRILLFTAYKAFKSV